MLVDWRGVAIALAVLAAVGVLCAIDISCTSGREPDVLTRVKGELKSGRREMAAIRRDQLAEQLRDLSMLQYMLTEKGELERAREVARLIAEIEEQCRRLDAAAQNRN